LYGKITFLFVELFVHQNLSFTSCALFFGWKVSVRRLRFPCSSVLPDFFFLGFSCCQVLPTEYRNQIPTCFLLHQSMRPGQIIKCGDFFFLAWNFPALWFLLPVCFDLVFTDPTKTLSRPRSLRSAAARDFISRWFEQVPLSASSWIHFPALRFSTSDPPLGVVPWSPVFVTAAASDWFFPVRSLRQEAEHARLAAGQVDLFLGWQEQQHRVPL
jgi:hypothetical protein